MHYSNYCFIISALSISTQLYATVGGPQTIEILGYESKDQKIYILRHYEDGRGRLPQLYYFDLRNKKTQQPIEVTSLYLDKKTGKLDIDGDHDEFDRKLKPIKSRLQPLYPLNPKVFETKIQDQQEQQISSWDDVNHRVPEYHYKYTVHNGKYTSQQQSAITYQPELKIHQAFRIPQEDKILITIVFLGINFETGYTIEEPILLSPHQ